MIVTFKYIDNNIDIKIYEKNKLKNVVEVLRKTRFSEMEQCDYVFSVRKNEMVSTELSAEEAEIYNGDILEIR
ncbi:MAG: hypothetical protein K5654_07395 [Lachnospiraceae bacterium]|nr:hypothetical protein [Lachnospiraceae bacterium]